MEEYRGQAAERIRELRLVLEALESQAAGLDLVAERLCAALSQGRQVFVCGNGGSAADSEHIAAEFPGARVMALTSVALVTAIANDAGYGLVFEGQLARQGRPGDVLLAISTSGESQNVLAACARAWELDMYVIGITGRSGGRMADLCDLLVRVPSDSTPRVQEVSLLIGHIIADRWHHVPRPHEA